MVSKNEFFPIICVLLAQWTCYENPRFKNKAYEVFCPFAFKNLGFIFYILGKNLKFFEDMPAILLARTLVVDNNSN